MPPNSFPALIGRSRDLEFFPVRTLLETITTPLCFKQFGQFAQVVRSKYLSTSPNFIVLFQSYPDQFSRPLFEQTRARLGLAPCLLVLGAALEGESRTGRPLPASRRIYASQWNAFHDDQLRRLAEGRPSLFDGPDTLGEDELCLARQAFRRDVADTPSTTCCIIARYGTLGNDGAMNRLFADLCRASDYRVVFSTGQGDFPAADLVLADADDAPFLEILRDVQSLRKHFADAEFNVCINSPRINEKIDLANIGVANVIAKPMKSPACVLAAQRVTGHGAK